VSAAWYANLVMVRRQAMRAVVIVLAAVLAYRMTCFLYRLVPA
jgi:hypothetical protein